MSIAFGSITFGARIPFVRSQTVGRLVPENQKQAALLLQADIAAGGYALGSGYTQDEKNPFADIQVDYSPYRIGTLPSKDRLGAIVPGVLSWGYTTREGSQSIAQEGVLIKAQDREGQRFTILTGEDAIVLT